MNKAELITHIADEHSITKIEAEKVIDRFTSSIISALSKGQEISLLGFGSFSISKLSKESNTSFTYCKSR